jgi:glycosyltransferase involved in cell wall biosynthesis
MERMREKSWQTIKNWSDKRMAWQFDRAYYNTLLGDLDKPWVSVIVPVHSHPEDIAECITRIQLQDYNLFETVIVDTSKDGVNIEEQKEAVRLALEKLKVPGIFPPIKYIRVPYKEGVYTLAEARNLGVLHASGDLLVFCDERIGMEQGSITAFVESWESGSWLWGIKDNASKGFVENFSAVSRKDLIYSGMFNPTICAQYGCMTQEIRTRLESRPFSPFLFAEVYKAKAIGLRKASSRSNRRKDIIESKLRLWKLYANTSVE